MFDSIIFDLNPYFSYSATFVYFSLHPLWICYAARCVHFTVPSRGVHSSFWGNRCTHLAAHSSKRLNPLSYASVIHQKTKLQDKLLFWLLNKQPLEELLKIPTMLFQGKVSIGISFSVELQAFGLRPY